MDRANYSLDREKATRTEQLFGWNASSLSNERYLLKARLILQDTKMFFFFVFLTFTCFITL